MSVAVVLLDLSQLLVLATDEAPEAEDVTAGWLALVIFLALSAAVVLLGFSLVKQLRKAEAAKRAGLYGDEPSAGAEEPSESEDSGEPA